LDEERGMEGMLNPPNWAIALDAVRQPSARTPMPAPILRARLEINWGIFGSFHHAETAGACSPARFRNLNARRKCRALPCYRETLETGVISVNRDGFAIFSGNRRGWWSLAGSNR